MNTFLIDVLRLVEWCCEKFPITDTSSGINSHKKRAFYTPKVTLFASCVMLYVEREQRKLINVININQFIMNSEISHEYWSNLL